MYGPGEDTQYILYSLSYLTGTSTNHSPISGARLTFARAPSSKSSPGGGIEMPPMCP